MHAYAVRITYVPIVPPARGREGTREGMYRAAAVWTEDIRARLQLVDFNPPLPREQIEEHTREDDKEHDPSDRRAHHGISQL